MLTAKMIARVMRMEEGMSNARAGLWRCSQCNRLYPHGVDHCCEYEDVERWQEHCREVRYGRLMP
jgi:recombinational DNA repair protein RecR